MSTQVTVTIDLHKNPWTDLAEKPVLQGTITRIGVLPQGMQSGAPSAALIVELEDGTIAMAQTSWRNLALAAVALIARWGTP